MTKRGSKAGVGVLLALASMCVAEPALAGEGLSIETGSPDALCPELASTRAAVSRRLGELIVPGGSSGFRARYTIAHAPVGSPRDFVRLELYGPEGTLQLSRDLPLEGESCSTMAEVIALVLDRYFRALLAHDDRSEEDERSLAAASPPAASAPAFPAPDGAAPAGGEPAPAAVPSADTPSSAAPSASRTDSERLALGALEAAFRSPATPTLGVRGLLELGPGWYVGTALHVGLRAQTERLQGGGRASSRDVSWRMNFGWGPRLGPVRTYVGPGVCLGLARGSGGGPREETGLRGTWAAGLDAGAIWLTEGGWSLGASAALDLSVGGGEFILNGQEVLEPEPLQGWFGLSIGHSL